MLHGTGILIPKHKFFRCPFITGPACGDCPWRQICEFFLFKIPFMMCVLWLCAHARMCVHRHTHVCMCVHLHMHLHMHVHMHTNVYACVCIYTCMCTCIRVHVHIKCVCACIMAVFVHVYVYVVPTVLFHPTILLWREKVYTSLFVLAVLWKIDLFPTVFKMQ